MLLYLIIESLIYFGLLLHIFTHYYRVGGFAQVCSWYLHRQYGLCIHPPSL